MNSEGTCRIGVIQSQRDIFRQTIPFARNFIQLKIADLYKFIKYIGYFNKSGDIYLSLQETIQSIFS